MLTPGSCGCEMLSPFPLGWERDREEGSTTLTSALVLPHMNEAQRRAATWLRSHSKWTHV